MVLCIIFSSLSTVINAENVINENHIHTDCCEISSITPLDSDNNSIVNRSGVCYLGHWFKTTNYVTGGICYAGVNPPRTCQIIIYEVVTCNNCGMQLSHTEYSRQDGCIFLENH